MTGELLPTRTDRDYRAVLDIPPGARMMLAMATGKDENGEQVTFVSCDQRRELLPRTARRALSGSASEINKIIRERAGRSKHQRGHSRADQVKASDRR